MNADARNLGGDAGSSSAAQRSLLERVRGLEAELHAAHEAEAQLQQRVESEQRSRRIVESTVHGIWTLDTSGRTTYVNDPMARMLGYPAQQVLGRPATDFFRQEVRDSAARSLGGRQRGMHEVVELPLLHRDGHEVWATMTISPLEETEGSAPGTLAMVTDATDKRRAEQEREELSTRVVESQKLESLGVLAGGIAHDFNNLLAAIMGHVEIASQEPGLAIHARTALGNALAAAQRAAGLTRQLLDYSGRSQLELRPVRLGKQSAEIVELLRASIPKRVTIELTTGDPSLSIMADPDRLQQATLNLVLNAAEAYGTRGGTVFVRVDREEIGPGGLTGVRSLEPVKPGEYVFFEVRDEGVGMDEQTLKRVFDPFFTTKTHGRGLGLAATLGIVRTHGGHLTVSSRLGEGTTFRAYFPRSREAEESVAQEAALSPKSAVRACTVLVVDDEPMVREFAHRLLEIEGYDVLEASSGNQALAILRGRLADIDGVLLDLSMPGMDGDALLSELRSFAPRLPVIVHSGHSLESTSERFAQWNIAGVLQKPYRAARLSQMVRSLFGPPEQREA